MCQSPKKTTVFKLIKMALGEVKDIYGEPFKDKRAKLLSYGNEIFVLLYLLA